MVKKYSQLYLEARKAIMATEDMQSAGILARQLLCHVSGRTQEQILADREQYASEDICSKMEELTKRLVDGEPLAYILGEWEFYGLPLYVDRNVLIPRDDTCAVAALAIQKGLDLEKDPRILDLCTGSGCIGLAIASRVKDARVTLADISKEALAVAKKNITRNHFTGRVTCIQADALKKPSPFLGKFDMIVSNPPYITRSEMEELPYSVSGFEPHMALFGGDDGLDFYRAIVQNYTAALKPGGYLCFEFGMGQGDAVCQILEKNQYTILERSRDYNERERAVIAQLNRKEDYYGDEKDSIRGTCTGI
ncbi:MAG: peptide chain release factor N(5)-glutamine methyltransferase [Ruminococcaceae bacterium]|nr:peptide chain release factor N(5)-glutamine methyltransferase [Oscillospiraceae bacterium]